MHDAYSAISDPSRRAILDRLRSEGDLSVTEIANSMPMTRQAVTKHLDILGSAGLVRVVRVGRERRHQLHAQPLAQLAEWLEPFEAAWDRRLGRLQRHLGERSATGSDPISRNKRVSKDQEPSCKEE